MLLGESSGRMIYFIYNLYGQHGAEQKIYLTLKIKNFNFGTNKLHFTSFSIECIS
jgi:hypothetical protein